MPFFLCKCLLRFDLAGARPLGLLSVAGAALTWIHRSEEQYVVSGPSTQMLVCCLCQSNLHTLPILNESDWCQPNAMTVTANQCNLMYSVIFAAMMYVNDLNKMKATG